MKLQRIIAKDSRSATEQAIAQYGRDVLVVSNSRVNGMTELIVAIDVEPEHSPAPNLRPGAAQAFESALQSHLAPTAASASPSGSPHASASALTPRPSTASTAVSSEASAGAAPAGFVPAHLALMQTAQRAAAAIESAAAQASSHTAATAHAAVHATAHAAATPNPAPTPPRASAAPVLRYGHHYAISTLNLQGLGHLAALGGLTAPSGTAPDTSPSASEDGDNAAAMPTRPTSAQPQAGAPIETAAEARATVDLIRQELAQLRKEMRMGQQLQAWAAQGRTHRWNEALTEVGVSTSLRALLISGLSNDYHDAQALQAIEEQVRENLPVVKTKGTTARSTAARAPWRSGVHLLSGPSGSGKTSMAARLAQEAAERLGVDHVVLVSWADARPGAWGQLQLWASRIGVSAFRAADTATLELLMQEHRGQLIIVDSGLSQPDILGQACDGLDVQHHLVMPADATGATLRRWMGEHTPDWKDLMVTRLDESAQPWPLLQACCEHQLQPVAASDGSGLQHLRLPYDAAGLLQHAMGLLAAALGASAQDDGAEVQPPTPRIEIPTIEQITTTVPSRQAGRSGRSQAARPSSRAVASTR